MQSNTGTTGMSNSAPSHEFASSADEQPERRIPAYVTPDGPSSPEYHRRGSAPHPLSLQRRRESPAPHPDQIIESVEDYEREGVPYCENWDIFRTDGHPREAHELTIRQQPGIGKVFIGKEKDRKPIDPPPVVQLRIVNGYDEQGRYLHSPYYFMSASLVDDVGVATTSLRGSPIGGTLVSSLHKVKDTAGRGDAAFFVFGDLSVKVEGIFRLKFTLFEMRAKEVEWIRDVESQPFQVYGAKTWPGMMESTPMTRMLSDQGIRLRLRKEPRLRLNPKGPASEDYAPRKYTPRRSKSAVEQDSRRESGASTMAPTPRVNQPGSDESGDNSFENAEEDQQQQDMALQSPLSPRDIQPMESFIAQQNESRKRELSMSSYHGTPSAPRGGGGPTTEPMPKRTRPDEDPTQPLAAGQGVYGQYPTPHSIDPTTQMYPNQDAAMQMYPPGQLGPSQPATQFRRQPPYHHGPPGYIGGRQGGGYDFVDRQAVSMSPGMYAVRPHPNYTMMAGGGQFQEHRREQQLQQQQSMLNPAFVNQQVAQQRMAHSVPARGMMDEGYRYDSTPDPAIDPLLAGQGQRQPDMMPRMSVPGMAGQPPQYYGQRSGPSPNPMMQPGMQSTPTPEMGGNPQFYGDMVAHQGIGMRGSQDPGQGIGFRAGLTSQDGVGFRETSNYAGQIPSHHPGVAGHHSGDTVVPGEVDMAYGHSN